MSYGFILEFKRDQMKKDTKIINIFERYNPGLNESLNFPQVDILYMPLGSSRTIPICRK